MASFLNRSESGECVIVKRTKNLHCNTILLTSFARPLQDTSMKIQPANTPAERKPLLLVNVILNKIEDVMNQTEKEKTGLTKLTAQELKNLNDFLNDSITLAPGPITH